MKSSTTKTFSSDVSVLETFSYLRHLTLYFSLIIGLAILPTSSSHAFGIGFCPRVFGMSNFNMTKFLGRWYEAEGYHFIAEITLACTYEDFYDNQDGTYTKAITTFEKLTRRKYTFPGNVRFVKNEKIAEFDLRVLVSLPNPIPFRGIYPYKVIDTDYTSYAIEFSCRQFGFTNLQQIWVITRNQTYTSDVKKRVRQKISSLGLDTSRLRHRQQNSCPADF